MSTPASWVAESPSRLVRGLGAGVVFGSYVLVFVQFSLLMKWQSSPWVLGKKNCATYYFCRINKQGALQLQPLLFFVQDTFDHMFA